MSITVTHLNNMSTDSAAFHSHSISQNDYEVPSADEFTALETKVANIQKDISTLRTGLQSLTNVTKENVKKVNQSLQKIEDDWKASLKNSCDGIMEAIRDKGAMSAVFQEIVNTHLGNIQTKADEFEKNMSDLMQLAREENADALSQMKKVFQEFSERLAALQEVKEQISNVQKTQEKIQLSILTAQKESTLCRSVWEDQKKTMRESTEHFNQQLAQIKQNYANQLSEQEDKIREIQQNSNELLVTAAIFTEKKASFWARLKWVLFGKH